MHAFKHKNRHTINIKNIKYEKFRFSISESSALYEPEFDECEKYKTVNTTTTEFVSKGSILENIKIIT